MPRHRSTSDPRNLLLVGYVGKTHGVRGEVKVIPETDDPQRLEALATVFLGEDEQKAVAYDVASLRFQSTKKGMTVILKLEGIDGMDEAAALRHLDVYAREEDLPPLADDEFFLHDLIGLQAYTDEEAFIGTVQDLLELPTHPVLVIQRAGQPEVLIPAVPAFIEKVDLEAERVIIRPIEGLLE